MPQLQFILRNRGFILWPRVEPLQRYAFSKVSDEPFKDGEKSPVDKIIEQHERALRARHAGQTILPSIKEQRRAYAFRIANAGYLGDPDAQEARQDRPAAQPIRGMYPETARGILEAAKAGILSDDVWVEDILPRLDRLEATAALQATV